MNRLIKNYLKGFALVCAIIAPLMMLLEALMDLQQPTLMSNIIDVGIVNHNLTYVLSTGGIMLACAFAGFIGGASNSVLASIAAIEMSKNVRQALFHKIQNLSCAEIDHFKTSSLITRLNNDVLQVQNMMLMSVRIMFRAPIICIGGIIMSILLIPKFAFIFAVILPVIIICIVMVLKKSMPLFIQIQEWLDKVNTVMRENLLGVRVIKSLCIENRQFERFIGNNFNFTEKSIQAQRVTFTLLPLVTLIMNLSIVFVLWVGGKWVTEGSLEIGKIMAYINYLVQITSALMNTVNLMVNISRAQASSIRINQVLDTQPSVTEAEATQKICHSGIEFRNVSFQFDQKSELVLKNISFNLKSGQTLGIIGATGSGKSSLVSLIPRLYDTTEGTVLVGGVDVRSISFEELRSKIGIVMQDNVLFSGTIAKNLRFGNQSATYEEMTVAAADAQAEFINIISDKFNHSVEQRGRNFSGGQKQRLSIARTLLCNPDILILDDSTSAVDLTTESHLRSAITARMCGKTIIVIAQRISSIKNADQILVLEHGQISAIGNHEELINKSPVYRSIVISQLGEEALCNAAC